MFCPSWNSVCDTRYAAVYDAWMLKLTTIYSTGTFLCFMSDGAASSSQSMDVDSGVESQQSQSSTKSTVAAFTSKTPVKSTMKSLKSQTLSGGTGSPKAKATPPATLSVDQVCITYSLRAFVIECASLQYPLIYEPRLSPQETLCSSGNPNNRASTSFHFQSY